MHSKNTSLRFVGVVCLIWLFGSSTVRAQEPPYGLQERVPNTSFLLSTSGDPLSAMDLVRAFPNLSFTRPVFLTHAGDGGDRIFVIEQAGVVRVFPNDDAVQAAATFLDIRQRVNDGPNEAGLLGLAFHPEYENNGRFFVSYTAGGLTSRISEFQVSDDPNAADAASERILLQLNQPFGNHNGGHIDFGPDGFLYISFGDGGSGGDPQNNAQNRANLLGAILRIDVDEKSGNLEYAIPQDNPFTGNANGWREEIWAYGMRNAWRMSFDRQTGALWAGDVGQGAWEEIDMIEKGGNYGWRIMEGLHCFNPPSGCNQSGLIVPVFEYDRGVGKSITGGYVYHGVRLPKLAGAYIYGDFVTRRIWGLRSENGEVLENTLLATAPAGVASFGEDEAGELYVCVFDGGIYSLAEKTNEDPPGNIPATVSESGLFADIAFQTPAAGIIPYSVNAELWSDGAEKTRFIALPGTTKIGFSPENAWTFPEDAVLVKNFFINTVRGNFLRREIVETRFLVKRRKSEQWDGFSYMWNDDGTDADLLAGSATKSFIVPDPDNPGQTLQREHYFPSRQECSQCHTQAAGFVLGVRTSQINKMHDYSGVPDNQMRSYNHIELFTEDIGEDYSALPQLTNPSDESADLTARARSYLDANCAQCHLPQGTGRSNIDFRFKTPLQETQLPGIPPTLGDLGVAGARRIFPKAPDSSVVYLRMLDPGKFRMPPLASSLVDKAGAEVIRQWILSLDETTDVGDGDRLPEEFVLNHAYPNPFNPATTISFSLPQKAHVSLVIFDVTGRKIKTLLDGEQQRGRHKVRWTALNDAGLRVTSGVYFYRLLTPDFSESKKVVYIR